MTQVEVNICVWSPGEGTVIEHKWVNKWWWTHVTSQVIICIHLQYES